MNIKSCSNIERQIAVLEKGRTKARSGFAKKSTVLSNTLNRSALERQEKEHCLVSIQNPPIKASYFSDAWYTFFLALSISRPLDNLAHTERSIIMIIIIIVIIVIM